jgi:hypothetical protein
MRSDYPDREHPSEQERRAREAALDETLKASFPASDPPSSIPDPADYSVLNEDLH